MRIGGVQRSAGYAGIAFLIAGLLSTLLTWPPPQPAAPAADIAAYLATRHLPWMISAWLAFPGVAFFLWFLVQLNVCLRLAPGAAEDGLPAYMLGAGVVASVLILVVALIETVLGSRPVGEIAPSSLATLWDFLNGGDAVFLMPVAIMLFAAAHSAGRHASMPIWAVLWGYLAAVGCAVGASSIFFRVGFLEIGGLGVLLVGGVPFAIWIVMASIVLIRGPKATAARV